MMIISQRHMYWNNLDTKRVQSVDRYLCITIFFKLVCNFSNTIYSVLVVCTAIVLRQIDENRNNKKIMAS